VWFVVSFTEDELPLDWKEIPPHCEPFKLPPGSDIICVDLVPYRWFRYKWVVSDL